MRAKDQRAQAAHRRGHARKPIDRGGAFGGHSGSGWSAGGVDAAVWSLRYHRQGIRGWRLHGTLIDWAKQMFGYEVEVVKRSELHPFSVLPKRWIVERTFAWLNWSRRLSKDYELLHTTSETMMLIAFAHILAATLCVVFIQIQRTWTRKYHNVMLSSPGDIICVKRSAGNVRCILSPRSTTVLCAVKGAGQQRVQVPPGNWIAPPGSNRSSGRGDEAAEASGVEGREGDLGACRP
jgi:transposase